MFSKTKEFEFSEETKFKNELIHFFNIDAVDSVLYIYLEIEGNRIKSEKNEKYCYKLNLKDESIQNNKKEINCLIIEDVELSFVIRIISNYIKFFKKRSRSFHKKIEERAKRSKNRKRTMPTIFFEPGMNIKEKIKLFSGGEMQKGNIQDKNIPGKLMIPKIFQYVNNKKNEENNKNKSIEEDKKEKDK
jgi:hypothetical protein